MGESVSEGTAIDRLEEVMARCIPKEKVVVESAANEDYVVVRRREEVAAFALALGTAPDPKELYRKEIDEIADIIDPINIILAIREPVNGVVCISAEDFTRYAEYHLPRGATYVRRGNRKIRFFSGKPSRNQGCGKKKFVPVPEEAAKVRNTGAFYQWLVPEPEKEGSYKWV